MTRLISKKFRRWVVVAAVVPGAAALAIGMSAASASAAPTWPTPSPSPTVVYTPPPSHHHHQKPPETMCFTSLEQEHDALPPEFNQGDQGNQGNQYSSDPAGQPSSAPVWGQPNGDHQPSVEREAVEVVQLVRVCVTEDKQHDKYGGQSWGGDRNRDDDTVTVTDLTGPFAWVVPQGGIEPTPTGLPSSIEGLMTH